MIEYGYLTKVFSGVPTVINLDFFLVSWYNPAEKRFHEVQDETRSWFLTWFLHKRHLSKISSWAGLAYPTIMADISRING
ncbi:MAG: hypothetical protein ACRCT1_16345, partial [Microcoleaceae cyanobacterium]